MSASVTANVIPGSYLFCDISQYDMKLYLAWAHEKPLHTYTVTVLWISCVKHSKTKPVEALHASTESEMAVSLVVKFFWVAHI